MRSTSFIKILSLSFGVLSFIFLMLSIPALNDIYHQNEPNLGAEWRIVRFGVVFSIIFVGSGILSRVYRTLKYS